MALLSSAEPNPIEREPKKPTRGWYLKISFPLIAAILTLLVARTVARIEDKYLQTHLLFFDPLSYQCHQCQLWLEAQHKPRWELALEELSQGTDVPDPFRTIPLILLNPRWLRNLHAHLITSGLGLFTFLWLLLYTVRKRTGNFLYALGAGVLFCTIPGFYDPVLGLGAFWLDLTAGFFGSSAALCLLNSERGSKMGWLAGFAILAGIASLARFVSGPYLLLQCGPVLAFYLVAQWRQKRSFWWGVAAPTLLIGAILALLAGWYLFKQTPGMIYYYTTTGYGYQDALGSAQFALFSTVSFLSVPLSIGLAVIAVAYISLGFRERWPGLLEALWLALSVGVFLSITAIVGQAKHAIQYFVPIAAFALLCPVDLRRIQRNHTIVTGTLGALLLAVASIFCRQDLQENLWRPPRPQPWDIDRKVFYEAVTKRLLEDYPEKIVAAYFDEFDEYVYAIGVENFGRPPNLLPDRVFSVHESYLYSSFPGKTVPELVEMAWQQANAECDIVLAFKDPGTAQVRSPYDYGDYLNPACSAIAFEMAKRLQADVRWRKLFVVPSKYLAGGVAVYANLNRFPEAQANRRSFETHCESGIASP